MPSCLVSSFVGTVHALQAQWHTKGIVAILDQLAWQYFNEETWKSHHRPAMGHITLPAAWLPVLPAARQLLCHQRL
jgi:hypothetical protein